MLFKKSTILKNEYFVLFLITILSLIIRIYLSSIFYGTSSDEFSNVFLSRLTFQSHFKAYPLGFMWFYYFASALLLFVIKDAFVATKAITILFGTLLIPIIYLIAKKIFDKEVALLSSFLLFINPEFTIISSVPLREPVYTFFIFTSILFAINKRIFLGAFSVGMSFLTRVEGLLISMPYYTIALITQKIRNKAPKIFLIITIFILFISFMNLWVEKPFAYVTGTFRNHSIEDLGVDLFVYTSPLGLILRIYTTILIFLKYLLNIIGPNLIFALVGTLLLFQYKAKEQHIYKIFTVCYVLHLWFWLVYIFIFRKIIFDCYRYLYPLIPFLTILLSYGFLRLYRINKKRYIIVALALFNIIIGYSIYYHNNGRRYFLMSKSNEELLKASLWIERNIPQNAEYKILADGLPYFYLFRRYHRFNTVMWYELYNKHQGNFNFNDLLGFIKQNNVKYVIWQNDNLTAMPVSNYFNNFEKIESRSGRFIPLIKFEGPILKALIYKFEDN